MEGSSLTHGCVTISTCNLRLSVKIVSKNVPKLWERSQTSSQTEKLSQKSIHAPEFTSSSSFPPVCRRDEVSRRQQPPTSAVASAEMQAAREGPWVPGPCPAPFQPHDEGPERGHGMWRGARGRFPAATGRPPTRGCPSPTRRPPAHLTVTLLVWRLT